MACGSFDAGSPLGDPAETENEGHQLWQNGNYPVVLFRPAVIEQKIDYIQKTP
jgi:hypothetical protein